MRNFLVSRHIVVGDGSSSNISETNVATISSANIRGVLKSTTAMHGQYFSYQIKLYFKDADDSSSLRYYLLDY